MYADGRLVKEIAAALGRSPDAATARRRLLRIPPRRDGNWSGREDALLRVAAQRGAPATWLAHRLERTPEAVRRRRRRLVGRPPAASPYTADEDDAIRAVFRRRGDVDALARELGRSPDAVRLRARALGVHQPRPRRRWTFAEDAIVRDGYDAGRSCASIADELPGRTESGVAARARKLGLSNYARRWTAADDAMLARLVAARRPPGEMARSLTRTPEAVRQRARRLGLVPAPDAPRARSAQRWTEPEDALLRRHAGANPATLANLLGRSDRAVAARLRALGLRAGRERSPHHPAGRAGRLTPAQRSALASAEARQRPDNVVALAHRLDVAPEQVRTALARRRY
jgi:hypothetical protein